MIDFIGQEGPTSKWKLALLDLSILLLQMTMVSVHVKKRTLKKKLAKASGGASSSEPATTTDGDAAEAARANSESQSNGDTNGDSDNTRDQDADAEERGELRRTDTLSDAGADQHEEDALLPSSSETDRVDALDTLSSGQGVIGEFSLIDTLLQEHEEYQAYRQNRSNETSATAGLSPDALRHLNAIRSRFGVGGG
jgi:hypothetical protein